MNLPNLITLGRLLLVPLAIWLILSGAFAAAFATFILAGLSDAADGFIARRFAMRTELGALLDPVADKALLVGVYATLGFAGKLPLWLVILVIFRDLMIVGGFVLARILEHEMRWEPLVVSKVNTAMQIALAAFTLGQLGFGLEDYGLVDALLVLTATTTTLSGAAYLVRWARSIAGPEVLP